MMSAAAQLGVALRMLAERRSGVQRGCDGGSQSPDFVDYIEPCIGH